MTSEQDIIDRSFMRRALELATASQGRTSPNPTVGAVLVKDGKVVGEGFHAFAGSDHAECGAVRDAQGHASGATLYVTLEPCCHYGKTPPCAALIAQAGIRRVVAACQDPNPAVNGKGFDALRAAGIAVDVGCLAEEAIRLNEAFFTFVRAVVLLFTCHSFRSTGGGPQVRSAPVADSRQEGQLIVLLAIAVQSKR